MVCAEDVSFYPINFSWNIRPKIVYLSVQWTQLFKLKYFIYSNRQLLKSFENFWIHEDQK